MRAKQNLESLLIMLNITSFIESDNFEFTMCEPQRRTVLGDEFVCQKRTVLGDGFVWQC